MLNTTPEFFDISHKLGKITSIITAQPYGKVVSSQGLIIEAEGIVAPVGTLCLCSTISSDQAPVRFQIVGYKNNNALLMPLQTNARAYPGQRIYPQTTTSTWMFPCGNELIGRVLDPEGQPLDTLGKISAKNYLKTLDLPAINPLVRKKIEAPLDVGVRSINSMLTVGQGQRMGIFAGSGVGKSTLLAMMSKFSSAQVVVVALIGERGREVREFIDTALGEALNKSVIIAAPADASPLIKMQGAEYACALAAWFRDQGMDCLLIMDSLTRYAMAAREVGLAVGEPPATKGYPPSVFAKIGNLVEKTGNSSNQQGSLTGFFTVLSEGDDLQDPIADTARAILDGHIVLSRTLADQGHYPPIDVSASVSRAFSTLSTSEHQAAARKLRAILSAFERNRDLINVGAYVRGSDPATDEAILKFPLIQKYLQQNTTESSTLSHSIAELISLLR